MPGQHVQVAALWDTKQGPYQFILSFHGESTWVSPDGLKMCPSWSPRGAHVGRIYPSGAPNSISSMMLC